jgi:hypothetical protein
MFTMVIIEGIKVKARIIPKKKLISIWKMLTIKPFPKVKAFQLENSDFDLVVRMTKSIDDERREIIILEKFWNMNYPTLLEEIFKH